MAPSIVFKHVTYSYSSNRKALMDISFKVRPESFVMVIGQTGSGKSTLIQQINGLLRPIHGIVKVGHVNVTAKMDTPTLMTLRKKVGLVFQVAQDQLFGETVWDDLAFGPKNFGFNSAEVKSSVISSAKALDLSKSLLSKSPFDLSGGQMKRVAIAGVLACHPSILILDEPTVGLDNYGIQRIMTLLMYLRNRYHLTIIMVTHQMDLVAKYATQVLVLKRGHLLANVTPLQLFKDPQLIHISGLDLPFAPRFAYELVHKGINLKSLPLNLIQLAKLIVKALKTRRYRE